MSNLFWLTDAQMSRLQPFFPKSHGKPRVDDRRVLSGIIFINRNGLRWCDAPKEYGPPKTLYNRWKRWSDKGVFARMMAGLAAEAAVPKTVKKVGPWVGLTPSRNQSGERDVSGGITKAGDVNLRRALCQAATVMMHRGRSTWLRTWAAQVARRRGAKRAMVALARRIGVILHRMWVDDTLFRSDIAVPYAA